MRSDLFRRFRLAAISTLALALVSAGVVAAQQSTRAQMSAVESEIQKKMGTLRSLEDGPRGELTKRLALDIRTLAAGPTKVLLATGLANLANEGDFGRATLQEVCTTLDRALTEFPDADVNAEPAMGYMFLAQFAHYEGLKVNLKGPKFAAALAKLDKLTEIRSGLDFSLQDLDGKSWKRSDLKGKVVLVNFWATWCPPCRKEMPDLDGLYQEFKSKGLVVLAISDEEDAKVRPFIKVKGYHFPVLLDPGRKVNVAFQVDGIPKSFVYDRNGKLVATAIDARSRRQFLEMLAQAGIK